VFVRIERSNDERALVCLSRREICLSDRSIVDASKGQTVYCKMENNRLITLNNRFLRKRAGQIYVAIEGALCT